MLDDLRLIAVRRYHAPINAEDLLAETLATVFTGKRKWRADLSLQDNLYRVMTSLASNEVRKSRRLVAFDDKAEEIENLAATGLTVLQLLEADEEKRLTYQIIDTATEGDPFLRCLVEQLLELGWQPTKIAHALDVDAKKIYSQKRRLQRKFAFLLPVKPEQI